MENELPHSRYPCGISIVFVFTRHFTTGLEISQRIVVQIVLY